MARLAARQHGVVNTKQLRFLGFSAREIELRIQSGRLHPVQRGVYAVGHPLLSLRGRRMAAVLRGGARTLLSHRPAGDEWGLRPWSGETAITVPGKGRRIPGVEIHASTIPPDERTKLNGIPITTVPRTLLDLATVLDATQLLMAVNTAESRQLTDSLSLPALLDRHRGERGAGALRKALDSAGLGAGVTSSALEESFVRFAGETSLPRPELNAPIEVDGRFYVADCLWRSQRVIVELQSLRHHSTRGAMAADAERTRALTLMGWTVIYVTAAQLLAESSRAELARDLNALLAHPRV